MATLDSELTLASDSPLKSWRARLRGTVLIQSSSVGGAKPREITKRFLSKDDAIKAYHKAVRKKMTEGFALVRDVDSASPGDLVLDLLAPNHSGAGVFDLSLDGSTIALGTTSKEALGAQIHLVNVATGRSRLIHDEPKRDARQTFLHAVGFDASGKSLVYALNGETRRLDLSSGATQILARFEENRGTNYNPFCVRPSWDGKRGRLLVFDAGDRVRILGRGDETLLEVSTSSPTNECRSGALSSSGKWLALYRSSRFLIYGHKNAQHDSTNGIEVWDIDAKALVRQIPVTQKVERVGFDPNEQRLLFSHENAQGPGELSIDGGDELWHNQDPFRTDRWGTCFSWSHSPNGQILAVGGFGLHFLESVRHTSSVTQPAEPKIAQRVHRIVFSADGSIVASGGDHGRLQVHKI